MIETRAPSLLHQQGLASLPGLLRPPPKVDTTQLRDPSLDSASHPWRSVSSWRGIAGIPEAGTHPGSAPGPSSIKPRGPSEGSQHVGCMEEGTVEV